MTTSHRPRIRISLPESRRALIISACVILLITLVLSWWFAWRPGTKDYTTANASISGARQAANTFSKDQLKDLALAPLNRESISTIAIRSVFYQESVRTLAGSSAVAHDHVVGGVFNQHKQTLVDFGKQIDDYAGSLLIFVNTAEGCNDMIANLSAGITQEEFDSVSQACRERLANSPPAPYKPIDSIYQTYKGHIKKVIDTYKAYFKAQTAGEQASIDQTSTQVQEAVTAAATYIQATTIKAPALTAPTDSLDAISKKLDSQKDVFFKW